MGINILKSAKLAFLAQKTDDQLMAQIEQGSSEAFQVLFDRHSGKILGYAKKLLGSKERAEEVSQEIWIKVVKLAAQYRSENHFKAWTMTMTKNHCLNILRKDGRIVFVEEVRDLVENETKMLFEKKFFSQFSMEAVSQAIDELPEKQRVALTILLTEEASYEEIAEQMNASLGAVKTMIHRGRKALQEKLREEVC